MKEELLGATKRRLNRQAGRSARDHCPMYVFTARKARAIVSRVSRSGAQSREGHQRFDLGRNLPARRSLSLSTRS